MKALSIKQPWAYLICFGMPLMKAVANSDGKSHRVELSENVILKDIENRDWPTEFRGRIYVHAPKKQDNEAMMWLMEKGFAPMTCLLLDILPRGVIIGEVDIIGCVSDHKSAWFTGPYGFVLANPVRYDHPIPCKGRQRFFVPDLAQVNMPSGGGDR